MLISWILQNTLIDYPWKIACEIFTAWCNFRCPFCHNPEEVLEDEIKKNMNDMIPVDVFFNFLKVRWNLLDWVVICWGEPTLQSDLYSFIKKIKADTWLLIKLDTNGRDFWIIKKLVDEKLVDYIAIDIKSSWDKYDMITGGRFSEDFKKNYLDILEFLKVSGINYEYRTTIIKWYHNKEEMDKIWEIIRWVKKYYIQNYKKNKTLDPFFNWNSFLNNEIMLIKKNMEKYVDFVWIRG